MTDISMIGLGAMGSALARAFLGAGHSVSVWNRSAEKMQPLVEAGALGADSLADAVVASPIVVICIDNYDVTRAMFEAGDALSGLDGKTVIQLSTGTPKEARDAEAWLSDTGAHYIDGAIMPYPDGIGAEDARLLFAGPEATYNAALPFLQCLGGDLRYLGENIAAAAVLDMAWLTYELCGYLAALHGANLCESEGVSVASLAAMYPEDAPSRRLASVIHAGEFTDPGATLSVWEAALQRVQTQAADAGINSEVPDLIASLFRRGIADGYGEEDVASVIKVLRRNG
jgi:3-hydroxyisobutyrate dehydrogenase-like beta-hydroxyacid dehydrogenase